MAAESPSAKKTSSIPKKLDEIFFPMDVQSSLRKVQIVYEGFLINKKTIQEYLDAITVLMENIRKSKMALPILLVLTPPFNLDKNLFQKKEGEGDSNADLIAALDTFNNTITSVSSDAVILQAITNLFLKYKALLTATSSSTPL